MTLTDLRYLVALGTARNFTHAAQLCHASQSTVSIAIRKIESELGATLFERHRNEVAPTEIGKHILERAKVVIELTDRITELAAQHRDPLSGPLRLGVIQTVAPYLLPMLVERAIVSLPQMPLLIYEDYKATLLDQVQKGIIDVAIVTEPIAGANLTSTKLYDEPFVVAVPTHHPWSKMKAIQARALTAQTTLLLGPQHCMRNQVLRICPTLKQLQLPGKAMARSFEASSIAILRYMVAAGLGVTVLPVTAVATIQAAGDPLCFIPFITPPPLRRIVLAWRKSYPRRAAITALTTEITELVVKDVALVT